MFLPLHDGLPMRHLVRPTVTWIIIGLCVAVHLASVGGLIPAVEPILAAGFGAVPLLITGAAVLPEGLAQAPTWLSPVTSLFLHGGWAHLLGNMVFLWVFADNVEDAMGHLRFLVFYLLCGVAAALSHVAMNLGSPQPLIGASGAVSGVIAAYLLLHPHVRIWGLVLKYLPIQAPAWVALGAWIGFQIFQAAVGGEDQVAWFAHLGGVAAGLALTPLFLRSGVGLRDNWLSRARTT